jgi:hypothetical protein
MSSLIYDNYVRQYGYILALLAISIITVYVRKGNFDLTRGQIALRDFGGRKLTIHSIPVCKILFGRARKIFSVLTIIPFPANFHEGGELCHE